MTVMLRSVTDNVIRLYDVGAIEDYAQDYYFVADHQKRDIKYYINVKVDDDLLFKVDDMVIPKNWIKDVKIYTSNLDPEDLSFE